MTKDRYNMSFTTGGLFYNESLRILGVYRKQQDWKVTQKTAVDDNLMQARTRSSAVRRVREICSRLKGLTDRELDLLFTGSTQEQYYLLWVSVCKNHVFITDFATKVVREKFLRMDLVLETTDYDMFFEDMAEWHEELEQLTDSTKKKLRQVLFKIMKEAEILSLNNMIIPGLLTSELAIVLADDDPSWLTVLPVSDTDIQGSLQDGL